MPACRTGRYWRPFACACRSIRCEISGRHLDCVGERRRVGAWQEPNAQNRARLIRQHVRFLSGLQHRNSKFVLQHSCDYGAAGDVAGGEAQREPRPPEQHGVHASRRLPEFLQQDAREHSQPNRPPHGQHPVQRPDQATWRVVGLRHAGMAALRTRRELQL